MDKNINNAPVEIIFSILVSIFITSLIITNIIAGKFFVLFNIPLSCGIIIYPITFLVTDIISEIYGEKKANMLIKIGFMISVVISIFIWISSILPTHPESTIDKKSYDEIFGLTPGITLGSMIAYLNAQYIDIKIFEFFRKLFPQYLWIRNNCSTITSQFVDTIVVVTFSLVIWPKIYKNSSIEPISLSMWTKIIFGQYFFKAVLALFDTPFVYFFINLIKKILNNK